MWEYLLYAALAALAATLLSLLWKLWKKIWGDDEEEEEDRWSQPRDDYSEEERRRQAEERARMAELNAVKVKQILDGDEEVAELFAERYGNHESAQSLSASEVRIKQIAAQVPTNDLELYNLASKQEALKFNMEAKTNMQKVAYPTDFVDVEPISDYGEMELVLPEQFLLPQEEFMRQLATDELLVMNFYESIVRAKLLYILLDISGSMQELLRSGLPKHIWARGVIVNLLLNARKEGGKFFFREFSDTAKTLRTVVTPAEQTSLAKELLSQTKDGGGTNISGAIQTAVTDIRTKGGDLSESELLIITDGQDEVDYSWLKAELGSDINLHYVALGGSGQSAGESLRKISKTYVQFD